MALQVDPDSLEVLELLDKNVEKTANIEKKKFLVASFKYWASLMEEKHVCTQPVAQLDVAESITRKTNDAKRKADQVEESNGGSVVHAGTVLYKKTKGENDNSLSTAEQPIQKISTSITPSNSTAFATLSKLTPVSNSSAPSVQIVHKVEAIPPTHEPTEGKQDLKNLEQKLPKITMKVSAMVTELQLETARSKFFHDLIKIKRVKKQQVKSSTEYPVLDITNLFFSDLMGLSAFDRLVAIYEEYMTYTADVATLKKAEKLADSTTCAPIRDFCKACIMDSDSRSAGSALSEVWAISWSIKLLRAHDQLMMLAMRNEGNLTNALKAAGYTTKRGIHRTQAVHKYLSDHLGIDTTKLQHRMQVAEGVGKLVGHFGDGVILLLPPGSANKLHGFGNQMMEKVYPLFAKHAAFLQPICDLLKEHMYQPIMEERPLELSPIVQQDTGLMSTIQRAIDVHQIGDIDMTSTDDN